MTTMNMKRRSKKKRITTRKTVRRSMKKRITARKTERRRGMGGREMGRGGDGECAQSPTAIRLPPRPEVRRHSAVAT